MDTVLVNSQFHIEKLGDLGRGSFAEVQRVKYTINGVSQEVAIKIFFKTEMNRKLFSKEVNELRKANHENIIKLIDYGNWTIDRNDGPRDCMIIELADFGSLNTILHENIYHYSLSHAVSWLYQCSSAINYLHSKTPKPTIHRDLKPLNLLLMKGGTILKVCDFGTVCNLKTIMSRDQGSPCWMAPETLTEDRYDQQCDVYSYTIIAWEVMARQTPYFHLGRPTAQQIMFGITGIAKEPLRPRPIASCPKVLRLLFERGMDGIPNKRPTMQFIYNLMEILNRVVNKEPIKPLCQNFNTPASLEKNESVSGSEQMTICTNMSNLSRLTPEEKIENNITPRSLSREMLNDELSNEVVEDKYKLTRYKYGRQSFKAGKVTFLPSIDSNNIKVATHRRSKSFGNQVFETSEFYDKDQLKEELLRYVETNLYEPLDAISAESKFRNQSMQINIDHKNLIRQDSLVQREIDDLQHQMDQLKNTVDNIKLFKDLLKQKNLLIKENDKLNEQIQVSGSTVV